MIYPHALETILATASDDPQATELEPGAGEVHPWRPYSTRANRACARTGSARGGSLTRNVFWKVCRYGMDKVFVVL